MELRQAEVWHKTQTGRKSISISWPHLGLSPIPRGQGMKGNQEAKFCLPTSLHHSDIQASPFLFLWYLHKQKRATIVFRLKSLPALLARVWVLSYVNILFKFVQKSRRDFKHP